MSFDGNRQDLVVGVVGTGAMGRGIIQVAAAGGMDVIAFDESQDSAKDALEFVEKMLTRAAEKGRMQETDAKAAVSRIRLAKNLEDLASCHLVVEAVTERLEVKRKVFAQLEKVVTDEAVLASNTSSLSVTAIAAATKKPDRVAGFHFFNPVPLMKLVEVIGGLRTSLDVTEGLMNVGRRMGREPVQCSDSPGFLVNHIGRGYMPEALRILDEGISRPADIDKILCEAVGFRMGPFALLDLVGIDVAHPVMESIYDQFYQEPMYKPFAQMRLRLQGGILGRKSGNGFYDYQEGQRVDVPDAPITGAMPSSVWISNHNPEGAEKLRRLVQKTDVPAEQGDTPSAGALCLVAPVGHDASTTAVAQGIDPARTVAVDTLFGLESRRTLMPTLATSNEYIQAARNLLGTDAPATLIKDSPGFISQRVIAMIVNVGCAIAQWEIATPNAIDLGARLGLSYPMGPLELGNQVGPKRILQILEGLQNFYGDPRYRPNPWLKRRALLGLSLRDTGSLS